MTSPPDVDEATTAAAPAAATFEQRALADGASPLERIDTLFRHTSRLTWLGVAALVVLAIAAIVWSAVAQLTIRSTAPAIITPVQGIYTVGELQTGQVQSVLAAKGDRVVRGQLMARLDVSATQQLDVRSTVAGTVIAVNVRPGGISPAGSPMFLVAPSGARPQAVALVPANALGAIAVGQSALVDVVGLSSSRYGSIRGRVASIADVPDSSARLKQLTGESTSAAGLAAQGPLYEAVIDLVPADNRSGVAWTHAAGADTTLPIGGQAVVSITVDRRSLISNVFG